MKIIDYFDIIRLKIIRNKKNIFMYLQFTLCTVLLLFVLNFKYNFYNLLTNNLSQNIGFKSLSVTAKTDQPDLGQTELSNIKNVVAVYSSKYDGYGVESDLKSSKIDGKIDLLYSDENIIPKVMIGESISSKDEGVAICPMKFYPSSKAYNLFIKEDEILNGEELIGKTFKARYYSYKNNNGTLEEDKEYSKDFKIVGVYDSELTMNTANSCYISAKDMISMKDSTTIKDEETFYNFVVVADSIDSIPKIKEEILSLGFLDASIRSEFDEKIVNIILLSCDLITSIIIFAICILAISYIKKKLIYENKFIGTLRSVGFTKKHVLNLSILEQFVINLISYMIGIVVFYIIFLVIKCTLLQNYIPSGFTISLFLKSFLYSFMCIVFLATLMDIYFIFKINKSSITKIVRSEK